MAAEFARSARGVLIGSALEAGVHRMHAKGMLPVFSLVEPAASAQDVSLVALAAAGLFLLLWG